MCVYVCGAPARVEQVLIRRKLILKGTTRMQYAYKSFGFSNRPSAEPP